MRDLGNLTCCLLFACNIPGTTVATEATVMSKTGNSILLLWIIYSNAGMIVLLRMSEDKPNMPSKLYGTFEEDKCYGVF